MVLSIWVKKNYDDYLNKLVNYFKLFFISWLNVFWVL